MYFRSFSIARRLCRWCYYGRALWTINQVNIGCFFLSLNCNFHINLNRLKVSTALRGLKAFVGFANEDPQLMPSWKAHIVVHNQVSSLVIQCSFGGPFFPFDIQQAQPCLMLNISFARILATVVMKFLYFRHFRMLSRNSFLTFFYSLFCFNFSCFLFGLKLFFVVLLTNGLESEQIVNRNMRNFIIEHERPVQQSYQHCSGIFKPFVCSIDPLPWECSCIKRFSVL